MANAAMEEPAVLYCCLSYLLQWGKMDFMTPPHGISLACVYVCVYIAVNSACWWLFLLGRLLCKLWLALTLHICSSSSRQLPACCLPPEKGEESDRGCVCLLSFLYAAGSGLGPASWWIELGTTKLWIISDEGFISHGKVVLHPTASFLWVSVLLRLFCPVQLPYVLAT